MTWFDTGGNQPPFNPGAPVTGHGTGYRCQWCEQPCTIEENQRGACDECSHAWDVAAVAYRRRGGVFGGRAKRLAERLRRAA